MATATIQGITFSDLTVSEMLALVNSVVEKVAPTKRTEQPCEKVERVIEKAQEKRENSDTHKLACGHFVPVSRGRYPASCDSCKGTVEKPANSSEESAEQPQKRNSDAWLTKPASEKQTKRILRKLSDERVSASMSKRLGKEIENGITGERAREINNALNAVLGIQVAA